MSRSTIERIRNSIRLRRYDMSFHAMEEMAEDNLDILDIERAVLNGSIVRSDGSDPRGTKYIVEGLAVDDVTPVGVVGRFANTDEYLIITVYIITEQG